MEAKEILLKGLAKALNAGGSAAVGVYDAGTALLSGAYKAVLPGEKGKLEGRIKDYEKRVKKLYYEIGKESSKYSDVAGAFETEAVKNLTSNVTEYESEINKMKQRLVEIEEEKKAEQERKRAIKEKASEAKKALKIIEEQTLSSVGAAIDEAVNQGIFETASEKETFERVAYYLLNDDLELKILSVVELGKIGNKAAGPVLLAATKFDEPSLTAEIINSLISIGDISAVPLFKEKVTDKDFMVRKGCLMGLYEFSFADSVPIFIDALKDKHAEIRIAAATFLGWQRKAVAVPALIEALRDKDSKVKKAVLSALANIKDTTAVSPIINVLSDRDRGVRKKALDSLKMIVDMDIKFDINASGKALSAEIEIFKNWWETKEVAAESKMEQISTEEKASAFTSEELNNMVKADLLKICKDRGIEAEKTLTKLELIKLILKKSK